MNSKQRRKILRKHKDHIQAIRVAQRMQGGDGLARLTDLQIINDLNHWSMCYLRRSER